MKKIVTAFFLICILISCTNRIKYSSSWQRTKVTADGKIPEWSNPLRFFDNKTGINYTISNDYQNLYLCCSISDEFLQTKILRSGLEFGIDTLGRKSFKVSIKYPVGNMSKAEPVINSKQQTKAGSKERFDRSAFKQKLIAEAREMQLVGFKPGSGKMIRLSVPNNTGISAGINIDESGIMYYEEIIPFSTFYKNGLTLSDSNIVFNYQIKVNPLPKSNNNSYSNGGNRGSEMGGRGMRGGGMGNRGMRGGGMGGGMHGGGMRGRGMSGNNAGSGYQRDASISGTTKISIKLKLAYK